MTSRAFLIVFVVAVAILIHPCRADDKPAPKGIADLAIDSEAWFAEFKKDPKAAFQRYKGKVVDLTGKVQSMSDSELDFIPTQVRFQIAGEPLGLAFGLHNEKRPWTRVAIGSTIKVRGKLLSEAAPGVLDPAEIIDPGPVPVYLKAEQLAKDAIDDLAEFQKQFKNNGWVHIEGEIVEVNSSKFCVASIVVKGIDGIPLECCFGGNPKDFRAAKAGQKIKFVGEPLALERLVKKGIDLSASNCRLCQLD